MLPCILCKIQKMANQHWFRSGKRADFALNIAISGQLLEKSETMPFLVMRDIDVNRGAYTCTSSGHVRFTPFTTPGETEESAPSQVASVPTRLCDFRLSPSGSSFSYGGEEVDLSVWDVEAAFSARSTPSDSAAAGQKRKNKATDLLPGETWRAKNVPNDHLNLRQPIHITSLVYLREGANGQHNLATGTYSGSVRSYDTRAGKRPVTDWKSMTQKGGVKLMEKGFREQSVTYLRS